MSRQRSFQALRESLQGSRRQSCDVEPEGGQQLTRTSDAYPVAYVNTTNRLRLDRADRSLFRTPITVAQYFH